jgi:hypothetical protein
VKPTNNKNQCFKEIEKAYRSAVKSFYLRFFIDKDEIGEVGIQELIDRDVDNIGYILNFDSIEIREMFFIIVDIVLWLKSNATIDDINKYNDYLVKHHKKDICNLKHWLVINKLATFKDLNK